jgi:hypothetical protein
MAGLDIASKKQLFVDDYIIESLKNAKQGMNPAVKVDHNPIIRPERPWEGNHVNISHVSFDENERIFKMWYTGSTNRTHPDRIPGGASGLKIIGEDDPGVACLATSEDGIHWERPELGLVQYEGSRKNNIIPTKEGMPFAPAFQDLHEQDPGKRYKSVSGGGRTSLPMKINLFYSPDGFEWTAYENNPVIDSTPKTGRWGPTNQMGWDSIRQTYAAYMENSHHQEGPFGKRIIGRAESPDMIHWGEAETMLVPDEEDFPDTEFYAMPVMVYEGLYVGLLWIFRTTNVTHHPEIVFSRDGYRFKRAYREPFIPRGGASVDFDSVSVYVHRQMVVGDNILTYYNGRNWRSPETLLDLGDKAVAAIGLAVTPLDGFVSVDGGKGGQIHHPNDLELKRSGNSDDLLTLAKRPESFSQMVTRSLRFSGTQLHLNMSGPPLAAGPGLPEVRVEVLTPNYDWVAGFSFDDADPIGTTGLDHVVSWKGSSDLSAMAGRPIKLRFYFKNAKLYSFQFK